MNKIALVIGINDYDHFDKLDNCINDATDIQKFLEKVGFEVTLLQDPSKEELENAIEEYKAKIDNDTIALFYYSGHALQLEQYNFFVSKDCKIKAAQDIPYNSTNISNLFSNISEEINFTHIVILDACRKNPFSTGFGKVTSGIGIETPRKGTIIAYAASPGKPSIERGGERNGVFTKHLLNNLIIPNVSIEQVLKNTRTEVLNDTNNEQLTWEESSLHGTEFCFIIEEEVLLEFQEIINTFIASDINLLLQNILPFLEPKYFHSLTIEHLLLALTLTKIGFEDEQNEIVQRTVDEDYLTTKLIDDYLPLLQTRIINEDNCENNFEIELFKSIDIIRNINYGYNEVLTVEDAFPHFMVNHIKLDGKEGLFSCFLSFENNEHFIKPMLFIKNETLEITPFKTLRGNDAVTFFKAYVDLRVPFEKEPVDLMAGFTNIELNTDEEILNFFKGDIDN